MGLLAVSEPLKFSKSPDTEMVPTKTLGPTVTVSAQADAVRKPRLKMVIAKLRSGLFMMMLLLQHALPPVHATGIPCANPCDLQAFTQAMLTAVRSMA
jgi:hypothetical protein